MVKFFHSNSPIKIKLLSYLFLSKNLQIFYTSLAKRNMCASLWFRVREKPEKYSLSSAWRKELYEPGPLNFIIWWTLRYTQNPPVCISGQYIYVTGLCNFLFVPQDLINRINSYFQRIAFQRNLLLIGF